METLIKSNDTVLISWIKYILDSHDINYYVMDESMAYQEGSITAIPIRVQVNSADLNKARNIIKTENEKIII
tara:strand:- start:184 stop:399 length:216 start_codon:yes stop_codon:yes gene_type:complete